MKFRTVPPAIALALFSFRRTAIAVLLSALTLFVSRSADAGTKYVGNSLAVSNGGPGGPPPLVILGEYSPAAPLPTAPSATTLPGGTVLDVKFYGQNYDFTLYALSRVASGPHTNEQTFRVVASESFSGSASAPRIQTLPVSNFLVNACDLLAFAGIGPYYSQSTNDALNSDATYEDAAYPGFLAATAPGAPGSQFTVGPHIDANANYEYISDSSGNQGRTYALGVDVTTASLAITPPAGGAMSLRIEGPARQSYLIQASTNLNPSNWVTLTNLVATNGTGLVVDSSASKFAGRFYRALLLGSNLPNSIITTVAGSGLAGSYSGDGRAATNAGLNLPIGPAVDAFGNLFIADWGNNVIRKVGINGIITTVAGNGSGTSGGGAYSGDGGIATNASLWGPMGVTVDAFGNLLIADYGNYRVRKVSTNGIITTVAGNGTLGYSGDGGPATSASFANVEGLAVDGFGNVFIADKNNNRIRKVSTNGIITTVAGNGTGGYSGDGGPATSASLSGPWRVAADASGNLFIADSGNDVIRKVSANGIITTVAGNGTYGYSGDGGPATNASFGGVFGVAVDASGNLFIPDWGNNIIREVGADGIITTVAGNGTGGYSGDGGAATNASLSDPSTLAVDASSNLFIAEFGNNVIRKVSADGIITTVAGNGLGGGYTNCGDGGPATNACLNDPFGMALDTSGNLFIADANNNVIREMSANGIISTFTGSGPVGFNLGSFCGDGGPATNACLNDPFGVAFDASGNLLIGDSSNNRVRQVDTNGIITTVAGNGAWAYSGDGGPATDASLANPVSVAVDASGNLFIADSSNNRIRKVDTNGIITTYAGSGPGAGAGFGYSGDGGAATNASLNLPWWVALDASGNLFIADSSNNRIRKVDTNGIITTVAGNGQGGYSGDNSGATSATLSNPTGVALDLSGNLFIADSGNNVIRKVSTNGIITTVAGNGREGYSGDGGAATSGRLNSPQAVLVDASGNLLIGDAGNNRIRKVTNPQGPSN